MHLVPTGLVPCAHGARPDPFPLSHEEIGHGKDATLGALGGALIGRSVKGVLAGAAAGMAGGGVVANTNRDYQVCIPAGATLTGTLKEPIAMTGGRGRRQRDVQSAGGRTSMSRAYNRLQHHQCRAYRDTSEEW